MTTVKVLTVALSSKSLIFLQYVQLLFFNSGELCTQYGAEQENEKTTLFLTLICVFVFIAKLKNFYSSRIQTFSSWGSASQPEEDDDDKGQAYYAGGSDQRWVSRPE